jgi:aldehyde:ferredoxin oxidoreductase
VTTATGEKGYNGKMLAVNLSTGEITTEQIPDETYRKYLGGYGLGARMALDRIPKGADPLGPENMLGIFPGALTGTPLFGQRFQVVCKSPLTGGWGDANCGGDFGPVLKHAGWDGIMVFGQATTPKMLMIDEDQVELVDAGELLRALLLARLAQALRVLLRRDRLELPVVVDQPAAPAHEPCPGTSVDPGPSMSTK